MPSEAAKSSSSVNECPCICEAVDQLDSDSCICDELTIQFDCGFTGSFDVLLERDPSEQCRWTGLFACAGEDEPVEATYENNEFRVTILGTTSTATVVQCDPLEAEGEHDLSDICGGGFCTANTPYSIFCTQ